MPKDYAEAVKWYRKAAEQGDAAAQVTLGDHYIQGRGVPKDYIEAAKWYRKSADHGHGYPQLKLGELYEEGLGVTKDYTEAAKWYRKAAEQDYSYAMPKLGLMYKDGRGVIKDDAEAIKWFRRAMEKDTGAGKYVGLMYKEGRGATSEDDGETIEWFRSHAKGVLFLREYALSYPHIARSLCRHETDEVKERLNDLLAKSRLTRLSVKNICANRICEYVARAERPEHDGQSLQEMYNNLRTEQIRHHEKLPRSELDAMCKNIFSKLERIKDSKAKTPEEISGQLLVVEDR